MEFTVKNSILKDAVANLIKLVPKKPVNPMWASIKIDAKNTQLKLTASSDNTGIYQLIDAIIIKEGSIAVKAETFANIIRQLPDDNVKITAKENELTIVAAEHEIEAKLPLVLPEYVIDITESVKECDRETSLKIKCSIFMEMIENTEKTIDDSNPILSGINIVSSGHKLHCFATDRYRMTWTWANLSSVSAFSIVVNGRQIYDTLKVFKDDEDIELIIYKKMLVIQTTDKKTVISLMSSENYPNIRKMVSSLTQNAKNGVKFVVPSDTFYQSLERLLTVADKTPSVELIINNQGITLQNVTDAGAIKEHIKTDIVKEEGKNYALRFNAEHLIDIFKGSYDKIRVFLLPPHNILFAATKHSIDLTAPLIQAGQE